MKGHPEVQLALQEADEIWLNPIVLGELRVGFMRGRRRKKNEEELREFLSSPRVNLAAVDAETAPWVPDLLLAILRRW